MTTLRWLVAALHLLGLAVGLGAVWTRGRALRGSLDPATLRRVFAADAWWGVAALIWLGTGLWRAFGGLEKGSAYYLSNHVFWLKMTLFLAIVLLELKPATTLTRWRAQVRRGQPVDTTAAPGMVRISVIQAVLVICIVFAATALARGFGA